MDGWINEWMNGMGENKNRIGNEGEREGSVGEETLKVWLHKLPVTSHWKKLNYSKATVPRRQI